MPPKDIYTVSRLAFEARGAIEKQFSLIWIEGEISNLSRPASGHLYFTLKDKQSQVRCALFRNRRQQLGVEPENGKQVLIRARVTLYEGRSEFQILVEQIEPAGDGLLLMQLEALKTKLRAEGLFDDGHKQALPRFPRRIALITSPVGAAVRDLLITLERRYPLARVTLLPSEVQGVAAADRLCQRLQQAQQMETIDLIILSRGGGSIEDLQPFNDEQLVRTIHACTVPVVAGIGHESDWTLADLVADLRAATPTAAAELSTPNQAELISHNQQLQRRLADALNRRITNRQQRLDHQRQRLIHPEERLNQFRQRLTHQWQLMKQLQQNLVSSCTHRLHRTETGLLHRAPSLRIAHSRERVNLLSKLMNQHIATGVTHRQQQVGRAAAALTVLNPLATLARGYAVVRDTDTRQVLTRGEQIKPDDSIEVQMNDANLKCRVESVELMDPS